MKEGGHVRTLPNLLSVFRIALVPVFFFAYFNDSKDIKLYATLIYAIAAFSDVLDGYFARKYKAATNLGKILDPMGDKLMTISVLTCITIDGIIPVWAVIIAFAKESIMALGGIIVHKLIHAEIPPSNIFGKTSTVLFFLVCVTLMLFPNIPKNYAIASICLALTIMTVALASYILNFIKVVKEKNIG